MQILVDIVTIAAQEDVRRALRSDPVISSAFNVDSGRFTVDAESDALKRIVDVTRSTSGIPWTPEMSYERREERQIEHFEVWARKLVLETREDNEANFQALARIEYIQTGEDCRIKLLRPVHLSHIKLKPNMAGGVGDWAQEYIVGSVVAQAFDSCGLKGYELLPVLNARTGGHAAEFFQIFTKFVLPPAVHDITTMEVKEGSDPRLWLSRRLGSLVYRPGDIPGDWDFSRTAEPWGNNELPFWVVSKKVGECFEKGKLKGWSFRPVLRADSDLYGEYLEKWQRLFDLLGSNPRNRVW